MLFEIGGEQVVRLTELRRNSKALIARLKSARNQQESRLILTTHGEPVAVLQDYEAYQKLLTQLEEAQRQLHNVMHSAAQPPSRGSSTTKMAHGWTRIDTDQT